MFIKTKYGCSIPNLPDDEKCNASGVSPMKMFRCPLFKFDEYGLYCVPSLCKEYKKGEEE